MTAAPIDHRDPVTRALGVFVLCVSVLVGWLYYEGKHEAERAAARDREVSEYNRLVTECQARFNKAVSENFVGRSEVLARETAALRRLVQAVGQVMRASRADLTPAQERVQAAALRGYFIRYDLAVEQLERYRKKNPFPMLPDCQASANLMLRDAGLPTITPSPAPPAP